MRKREFGFTLIEVVVVIAVLGVLSFILTNVLSQTLVGENKVKAITEIKQNGSVILDRISSEVRQAEKVVCINGDQPVGTYKTDTLVLFHQGTYTRFRFYPPGSAKTITGLEITPNGFITVDNPPPDSPNDLCTASLIFSSILAPVNKVSGAGARGALGVESSPTPIISRVNYLSNIDPVSGVSVSYDNDRTDQVFRRLNPQAGFNDVVNVKFRLFQGVSAGQPQENKIGDEGILFSSTVQLRGGK